MSTTVASLLRGHKGFGKLDDEKDLLVPYLPHWEKKKPDVSFLKKQKKTPPPIQISDRKIPQIKSAQGFWRE